jgi:hypothetical protein
MILLRDAPHQAQHGRGRKRAEYRGNDVTDVEGPAMEVVHQASGQ